MFYVCWLYCLFRSQKTVHKKNNKNKKAHYKRWTFAPFRSPLSCHDSCGGGKGSVVDTGRVAGALLFSKGKAYICPTILRARRGLLRARRGLLRGCPTLLRAKTSAPEGMDVRDSRKCSKFKKYSSISIICILELSLGEAYLGNQCL